MTAMDGSNQAATKSPLAEIQTRLALVEQAQSLAKEETREIKELLKGLDTKMDLSNDKIARYEGKLGGIILAFSAIVTAVAMFGEHILKWLKG